MEELKATILTLPTLTVNMPQIHVDTGTRKHSELLERELADQHPISAITGLETTLEKVSEKLSHSEDKFAEVEKTIDGYGLRFEEIDAAIEELSYKPIQIVSFKKDEPTVAELGSTIEKARLSWELSKKPVALKINDIDVEPQQLGMLLFVFAPHEQGFTKTTSWVLNATDEKNASDSATVYLYFYNGIYYGNAEMPENINGDFLRTLKTKILTNQKNRTVVFDPGAEDSQHLFYAYPKRLGPSVFNIFNLDYEFNVHEISFTNNFGYTEDYYVYVSNRTMIGKISTTVKDG